MAEPKTRAKQIERLLPWLLHWTIDDERIGRFRSDSFAVETADGLMVIDPVPLEANLQGGLTNVRGIFLTHGNHQRSAWRLRKELGAPVYAPSGVAGLDEEPDVLINEQTALPGGLQAVRSTGFQAACYLTFTHADGTGVLFCGDLICHDPGGPYRFPVQEGYFDPAGGKEDAAAWPRCPSPSCAPPTPRRSSTVAGSCCRNSRTSERRLSGAIVGSALPTPPSARPASAGSRPPATSARRAEGGPR